MTKRGSFIFWQPSELEKGELLIKRADQICDRNPQLSSTAVKQQQRRYLHYRAKLLSAQELNLDATECFKAAMFQTLGALARSMGLEHRIS